MKKALLFLVTYFFCLLPIMVFTNKSSNRTTIQIQEARNMNINTYKNKVKKMFKDNTATKEQWDEMAEAVLQMSESNQPDIVEYIDRDILPASHFEDNEDYGQ